MNATIKMTIEVTPEQANEVIKILSGSCAAPAAVPHAAVPPVPIINPQPAQQIPTAPPIAPVQNIPVQPAPVTPQIPQIPPVTQRTYTQDELALASRPICEAGRQAELINLLHSFTYTDSTGAIQQVQSIQQLPPDMYPDFANGIRALGGKI